MCLEDFLKYFISVSTCFIRSPQFKPWFERRFDDQWSLLNDSVVDTTCTAVKPAHMYELSVCEAADVWAIIYQSDAHLPGASALVDQGILVVRIDGQEGTSMTEPRVVLDTTIQRHRQSNETARLGPGRYIVLPYSSGTQQKGQGQSVRPFHVAVLSDVASTCHSLRALPFSLDLQQAALLSLVQARGSKDVLGKNDLLCLMQLRHGASHLYACSVNATAPSAYVVTLDSAASSNVHTPHAVTAHARLLPPGGAAIFHHLTPINDKAPAAYNIDLAYKSKK